MITKEELLVALEDSSRNLYKSNEVFGLALKGLESESTVKRLIQARDDWKKKHDDLVCEHRITANNLRHEVDGLTRSRNFWRKKYDDLADELDGKIIALEEKLKDKDADLAEASKTINSAWAKHRDLGIQTAHLKIGRKKAEDQIGVLEDKLRDTVNLKHHDELISSARRRITALLIERDAFAEEIKKWEEAHRAKNADIDKLFTENKELSTLKDEIEKCEEAHYAKNAVVDKLLTENKELARRERELMIVLGEWVAVEFYLAKSPKLTIGDKFSVACLRLLKERDELEADLRFLLGQ